MPVTLSWVRYENSLRHSRSFSRIAAYDNDAASLSAPSEAAEQIPALRVTSSFFPVTQGGARMIATIDLAFAVVALAMALVGLYAVLSQGVASRTAEIGVRIALGATPGDVAGMILRSGMALVLPGVAAGVAVSLAGAQFLASQLFLVNPRDPWIIAGVSLAFGLAGAVACMLPSWRAARLDPIDALRRV
ncbi:MAG: FtsX-like permease family protein [Bryobacteraceae bacterium]|nr:FtsX-like permease family protein [Bryobacteraceae bacterium]